MKVVFLWADNQQEFNTSWWRCFIPAEHLTLAGHSAKLHHVVQMLLKSPQTLADLDEADVVVVERLIFEPFLTPLLKLKAQGKRIVATFDDAYHLINDPTTLWRGAREEVADAGLMKQLATLSGKLPDWRAALRQIDRAIVPSQVLVEDYKQFCPDIRYVPNCSIDKLWSRVKCRPPDNFTIIGWGGTTGHVKGWQGSGLIAALATVAAKHRVLISVGGGGPEVTTMFSKRDLTPRYTGWVRFEDWPHVVGSFDIGVAPLHGEYDRRRSDIKALEYGMAGIPWVATDAEPYHDARGGLLVKNRTDDWGKALRLLLDNLSLRASLGEEGRTWAEKRNAQCASLYEWALGE